MRHEFWKDVDAANTTLVAIDELKSVLNRLDTLTNHVEEINGELARSPSTKQLEFIQQSIERAEQHLEIAERELMRMGGNGMSDILVAITPISGRSEMRDLLYVAYTDWCKWRGYSVQLLTDPLTDSDTVFLAIQGANAFGYLQLEHGLHRLRKGDQHDVARVVVAPWTHETTDVVFGVQRALKQTGKFGDKVRSQVEVTAEPAFSLQNRLTIGENRELAREIAASWKRSKSSDTVVRRYDLEPFLVKDHLTGVTSGRQTTLKASEFHDLLSKRVDAVGDAQQPFYLLS
jgi:protein subunit release factor B